MKKTGEMLIALTFWILFSTSYSMAEVLVEGVVDRPSMLQGDSFTLSIRITSKNKVRIQRPDISSLKNFEILSQAESQQTQNSFGTGGLKTTRTKIFSYNLIGKKNGTQNIPPIKVLVSGKPHQTKPIQLNIYPQGQAPPHVIQQKRNTNQRPWSSFHQNPFSFFFGQDSTTNQEGQSENDFFIRATVDKSNAYVGEQIMVHWHIYARRHVRRIDTLKYPNNKGFWKEDIFTISQLNFTNELVNGVVYKKALLASYALFPLKEGTNVIDPYKVRAFLSSPVSFGFTQSTPYTRTYKPIPIEVIPLPKENQPPDFSGAVGTFQVTSYLDEDHVPIHQPVALKIKLFGQGNSKLIDLPQFSLPDGLEIYDTKKESIFFKDGKSEREFTLLIVSRSEGFFVIPSIHINIFNPKTGEYYVKKTQAHGLTVEASTQGESIISTSPLKKTKKNQLPPLIASWEEERNTLNFSVPFWILVYSLVLIFLIWRFVVEFGLSKKKKDWYQLIHLKVRHIEELIKKEQWRQVGSSVTNLVCKALGEVSGLGGASFELDRLIVKSPPSVRRELGDTIKRLYKSFETLSFAPNEMMDRLKNKEDLVKQLLDIEKVLLKVIDLGLAPGQPKVVR